MGGEPDRKGERRVGAVEGGDNAGGALAKELGNHADAGARLEHLPMHKVAVGKDGQVAAINGQARLDEAAKIGFGRPEADEVGLGQSFEGQRAAESIQIALGHVKPGGDILDFAGDQLGLIGAKVTDGDIGFAAAEIGGGVLGDEIDGKARSGAAQLLHDRREEVGGIDLAGGNGNGAFQRLGASGGPERETACGFAHGADMFEQIQPAGREFEATASALEENHAQFFLQRLDLAAQRRLGHAQSAGGGGQGAFLGRHQKGPGTVPVKSDASPIHAKVHTGIQDLVNSAEGASGLSLGHRHRSGAAKWRPQMKAIVTKAYGGPEVLSVAEIARPQIKDNEILVKIYATAVTQADVMMRTGTPWFGRAFLGWRKPKAPVPGTAFAGKIVEVGKAVTRFKLGDDVFGETSIGFATHAQFVSVPEDGIIETIPMTMSYEDAAPVTDGALTSHNFLTRLVDIRPGQKVLINGAAGGLGTSAVQLAKDLGAEVTAVASGRNADFLRELGADHVIDYGREDFSQRRGAYDVIFDTVGKVPFGKARRALKADGIYLSPVLGLGLLFTMLWTGKFGRKKAKFSATGLLPHAELRERLGEVKGLIEDGALRTVIDRRYDLEDVAKAHRYVESGHKRGNVVIEIAHADVAVLAA